MLVVEGLTCRFGTKAAVDNASFSIAPGGFVGVIGLAVMISQFLGHFGEAVASAALDFVGGLQMQRFASIGEQGLV